MIFGILFAILYLPIILFYPTKVIYKEKMPKEGKMVITSNHYSNLDALIYNAKFATKFRFMAKIELFKNKFSAFILKSIGAFPVDREHVSPSVIKKTVELINKNKKVFIFPEGTRNKDGGKEMIDAKAGVILFASKSGADIIPMLMYRPPKLFRKNYIIVGNPFKLEAVDTRKLTKEELASNLERYEKILASLREKLEEKVDKKYTKKK